MQVVYPITMSHADSLSLRLPNCLLMCVLFSNVFLGCYYFTTIVAIYLMIISEAKTIIIIMANIIIHVHACFCTMILNDHNENVKLHRLADQVYYPIVIAHNSILKVIPLF